MEIPNTLLQEGRLLVKTEGPLGRRSWILRYILLGERTLEWYADVERNQLVGSVSLDGAVLLEPENPKHPYMIELDWDGQDYLPLRALSLLEFRNWITALNQSEVTVSPSVLNTLMAQDDMMYQNTNSSLNSSYASVSPSRKLSAVSASSTGTNTASVTSSPSLTASYPNNNNNIDPKLYSQPGGMLSPGDVNAGSSIPTMNPNTLPRNTTTTTGKDYIGILGNNSNLTHHLSLNDNRTSLPPPLLLASSPSPMSNTHEPLNHPLNHPTMVGITSSPVTGTIISPIQLKEAKFDPTVTATETVPNVSIANIHRQRASQAAAIARMMVKTGVVTGNVQLPNGKSGGKRPPPPPPPALTPEELQKLLSAATVTTTTTPSSLSSSTTTTVTSESGNSKEEIYRNEPSSVITMASPSSILNSNSSVSSSSSSTNRSSLPFASTLIGHGSLYILRPTPTNHLANVTNTVNTPTEVWMPRYGILDGHEIHLYQSNKANRELETVELVNAIAVHAERKASPPPLAECIMVTLASGTVVYFAIPMVSESTLSSTIGNDSKLLSNRDNWIYAINTCSKATNKMERHSTNNTPATIETNDNNNSNTVISPSQPSDFSSSQGSEHPNIPPHKRSKWNKLRMLSKFIGASSRAQENTENQATIARQNLLDTINQSSTNEDHATSSLSTVPPVRSISSNSSSSSSIDDDIRHSPVPLPSLPTSASPSIVTASRSSNDFDGNIAPSFPTTTSSVSLSTVSNPLNTVSPRSRSSSHLSSSSRTHHPYSFSVRITKLNYEYITSLPSITNKLENALLDDCVFLTNEPRDIFSITKLSAGSVVAKMMINDRPIEKAVLLGQKIRTAMEHPDNIHTPAVNRIIQDQIVHQNNTVPMSKDRSNSTTPTNHTTGSTVRRSLNRSSVVGVDPMAEYVALDPHFPIGSLPIRVHHYLDAEVNILNKENDNNNDADDTPIPIIEVPTDNSHGSSTRKDDGPSTKDTVSSTLSVNVSVIPEENSEEDEDNDDDKNDKDHDQMKATMNQTNEQTYRNAPSNQPVLSFQPSPLLHGGELITEVIAEVPEPEQSRSTDHDDSQTEEEEKNNNTDDNDDEAESVILVDHTNEDHLDTLVIPAVPKETVISSDIPPAKKGNGYTTSAVPNNNTNDNILPDNYDEEDDSTWLNGSIHPTESSHVTSNNNSPRTNNLSSSSMFPLRNLSNVARLMGNNNNPQSSLLTSLSTSPSNSSSPKNDGGITSTNNNDSAIPNYLRKLNRDYTDTNGSNPSFTLPPALAPQLIRSRYFPSSAISPLDRINRDAGLISNRSVSNALSNAVAHRISPTASSSPSETQTTVNDTNKGDEPTKMLPLDDQSAVIEPSAKVTGSIIEPEEEKKTEDRNDAEISNTTSLNPPTTITEPIPTGIASEIAAAIAILSSPSLISSPSSVIYRPVSRMTNTNENENGTAQNEVYPLSTLSPGSGAHVHHSPYKASLPLPPSVWTPRPVVEEFIKNELQAVHNLLVNLPPSTIGTIVSIPASLITSLPTTFTVQRKNDDDNSTSSGTTTSNETEQFLGQLISSLIHTGESTKQLIFPLEVKLKENLDILDECLDIAGVGYTLTEKDAELLQPGAQAVQLQINPTIVETISLRIARILHGDSVWRMAPVTVNTPNGKENTNITNPTVAAVASPEPLDILSPSSLEEKRKIDSLISEPLTSDTVKKQKDALLKFYEAIVPSKATDDHVNLAWENYGISVWPALASKYSTSVVAPYAAVAGLPLPLLVPGRLESELAEIRARRPSDANSIATAGMSVNLNPYVINYSQSPVMNISPNNLRSFSFSNTSPGMVVPNNTNYNGTVSLSSVNQPLSQRNTPLPIVQENGSVKDTKVPSASGTPVPLGTSSPVNLPSPGKTSVLPHLHQRLQHKSPIAGTYSPASIMTGRGFSPNTSFGNTNTVPNVSYTNMNDDAILQRMNELTNIVDTSRKQLDDLYTLYDTLQATRLSGRGSTTAGPMLAEILKGIEKMQNSQQNAQAELSTLAAALAERALSKISTVVPEITVNLAPTETGIPSSSSIQQNEGPTDSKTEEEKKDNDDDNDVTTNGESSTVSVPPVTTEVNNVPVIAATVPLIPSRTATPLNNRPWLFNARINHGNYDEIVNNNPERKQELERALLNDCSKLTNLPKDIFLVIALAKGSIIVTMGILGGLCDEDANAIGERLRTALELTDPDEFTAVLPEVAALLLPPKLVSTTVPTDNTSVSQVPEPSIEESKESPTETLTESVVPFTEPTMVPSTEGTTVPIEEKVISNIPVVVTNNNSTEPIVTSSTLPADTTTINPIVNGPEIRKDTESTLPTEDTVVVLPNTLLIPDIDNLPEPTVPLTVPRTRRAQQHRSILETPSFQKLMAELDSPPKANNNEEENEQDTFTKVSSTIDDISLDSIRAVAKELGLEPLDYPIETTMATVPVDSASISSPIMDSAPPPSLPTFVPSTDNNKGVSATVPETIIPPVINEIVSIPTVPSEPKEEEDQEEIPISTNDENLEKSETTVPSSVTVPLPPSVPSSNEFTSIDDDIPLLSITPTRARTPVSPNEGNITSTTKPLWSVPNAGEIESLLNHSNPLGINIQLVRSFGGPNSSTTSTPSNGILRYIGPTQFDKGNWLGIELEKPEGYTDGTVEGVSYFICSGNANIGAQPGTSASLPYGIFVTHPLLELYRKPSKETNETVVPPLSSSSSSVTETKPTDETLMRPVPSVTTVPVIKDSLTDDSTSKVVPISAPSTVAFAAVSSSVPVLSPSATINSGSSTVSPRDGYIVHIPGRRSPMSGNNSIATNSTTNGGLNMVPLPNPVTPRVINNKLLESVMKGISPSTPPITDIHIYQANNPNTNTTTIPPTPNVTNVGSPNNPLSPPTTANGRKAPTSSTQTTSPRPRPEWNSSTRSTWSRTDWREKLSQLDEKPLINDEEIIFVAANPNTNNSTMNTGSSNPKAKGGRNGTFTRESHGSNSKPHTVPSDDNGTNSSNTNNNRDDRSVMSMVLEDAKTSVLSHGTNSTLPPTVSSIPSPSPLPTPTGMVRSPVGILVPVDPSRAIHSHAGDIFVLKAGSTLPNNTLSGTGTMLPSHGPSSSSIRTSPLPKVSSSPSPPPPASYSSMIDDTLLPIITDEPVMLPGGFTGQRSVLASPQLRKDPSFGGLAITSTPVPGMNDGTVGMLDDGFKPGTLNTNNNSFSSNNTMVPPVNMVNNNLDASGLRPDSDIDAEVDPKLVAWLEAQGLGHIINPLAETIAVVKYALTVPDYPVPPTSNDTLAIPILLSDVASLVPEEVAALPGITPAECTKLNEAITVLKVLVPPKLVLPVILPSKSMTEVTKTDGSSTETKVSSTPSIDTTVLPMGGKLVNSKLGQLPPLSDASFSLSSNDNNSSGTKDGVPKGSTLGAEAADAALKRANHTLQAARRSSNHSVTGRIKQSNPTTETMVTNTKKTAPVSTTVNPSRSTIEGPEITLRDVRIVANTVNADGTPEIILSQAHLDALLGTPSNGDAGVVESTTKSSSQYSLLPKQSSNKPKTDGGSNVTSSNTNDTTTTNTKIKRPRVPSHIVPPRPRTNTTGTIPEGLVSSFDTNNTVNSSTVIVKKPSSTNNVRFATETSLGPLPTTNATSTHITNMNAQSILQSHGIAVTMVKDKSVDKDNNNNSSSNNSSGTNSNPNTNLNFRPDLKAAAAHIRSERKSAHEKTMDKLAGRLLHNPTSTNTNSNTGALSPVAAVNPINVSVLPVPLITSSLSTVPSSTNGASSSIGLNRFKALQAVAAGLPPSALVNPSIVPAILPSLPNVVKPSVSSVPIPVSVVPPSPLGGVTKNITETANNTASPKPRVSSSTASVQPPHHHPDDSEHHKRTKKQKKHHKKDKHADHNDHDNDDDDADHHTPSHQDESTPLHGTNNQVTSPNPTILSSTLYPVSPSPPVEAMSNSPDGKNNVYGNSLLAAANMRGLTSPGSPLVPNGNSGGTTTVPSTQTAKPNTSTSSLLSPTGAVRSAAAPDIQDDLADFLMRHGFYHYSFTFSLFDISTLDQACHLTTEKLKEMALPDKDATHLAHIFAKQLKMSGNSSSSKSSKRK